MSLRIAPTCGAYKATSTLAAKQYYAVKLDGDSQIVIGDANCKAIGFLQNAPAAGDIGYVAEYGHAYAIAGEALTTPGTFVKVDANGAIVAVSADADIVVGQTISEAAAAGDVIEIRVIIGMVEV